MNLPDNPADCAATSVKVATPIILGKINSLWLNLTHSHHQRENWVKRPNWSFERQWKCFYCCLVENFNIGVRANLKCLCHDERNRVHQEIQAKDVKRVQIQIWDLMLQLLRLCEVQKTNMCTFPTVWHGFDWKTALNQHGCYNILQHAMLSDLRSAAQGDESTPPPRP